MVAVAAGADPAPASALPSRAEPAPVEKAAPSRVADAGKKAEDRRVPQYPPNQPILPPPIPLGPGQTESESAVARPRADRPAESGSIPYSQEETPGSRIPGQPEPGAPSARPLELEEVLASVDNLFPLLIAAQQERLLADGDVLSAIGAYDLTFSANGISNNIGYYSYARQMVSVEQQLGPGGVKVFSGWRRGQGQFPVYYGERETYGGGEFIAGAKVPLLRNRSIDKYRAELRKATIARAAAEPDILKARLQFLLAGRRAYWDWLAAGQAYSVALSLVEIAERRDAALARRIEEGVLEGIERTDNQRVIVQRQAKLIATQQKFQQASIKLSLFYRDDVGQPVLVDAARLPAGFPAAEPTDRQRLPDDISLALASRPELVKIRLAREKANVDLRYAENEFLPNLDAVAYGSQDVGDPTRKDDKGPFQLEAGLYLDVPLQRRYARGRILTARTRFTQIAAEERFLRDKVVTEVQAAVTAIEAAYRQIGRARKTIELARVMEQAERTKLELGRSNILFVNLREMATVDAAILEIEALAEYFDSVAEYRAALALDAHIGVDPAGPSAPLDAPPHLPPHVAKNLAKNLPPVDPSLDTRPPPLPVSPEVAAPPAGPPPAEGPPSGPQP